MKPAPEDFPVNIRLSIQWGDQDAFGHVNNIHFLRWFESARIEYLIRCNATISNDSVGPILASVHCDYRQQILFPDDVIVSASVNQLGNSSITIQHYIWSESKNSLVAEGQSIVVMFDYQNQKPVAVSEEIREAIRKLESE